MSGPREEVSRRLDALGWTQADLHRESGVPEETISRFFNDLGRRPSETTLQKFEEAIGPLPRNISEEANRLILQKAQSASTLSATEFDRLDAALPPPEREAMRASLDASSRATLVAKQEVELRQLERQKRIHAGLERPTPPAPSTVDQIRKAAGAQSFGPQGALPAKPTPEALEVLIEPIMKQEASVGHLATREAGIALLLASQPELTDFVEAAERARIVKAMQTGQTPPKVTTTTEPSTELTPVRHVSGDIQSRVNAAIDWARKAQRWDLLSGSDDDLVAAWMQATQSGHVAKAEPSSDRTVLLKAAYRWANAERRYDLVDGPASELLTAHREATQRPR